MHDAEMVFAVIGVVLIRLQLIRIKPLDTFVTGDLRRTDKVVGLLRFGVRHRSVALLQTRHDEAALEIAIELEHSSRREISARLRLADDERNELVTVLQILRRYETTPRIAGGMRLEPGLDRLLCRK